MSKVRTVAWRDFRYTVMTKAFLFAIVGIPIMIIGVMVVIGVLVTTHKEPPLVGTVAVVDAEDELADAILARFDRDRERTTGGADDASADEATVPTNAITDPAGMGATMGVLARGEVRIDVERVDPAPGGGVAQTTRDRLADGDFLAVTQIPDTLLLAPDALPANAGYPNFELLVGDRLDSDHVTLIERRIGQAVVRVRAVRSGLDPEETLKLLDRPRSKTSRLLEDGNVADDSEEIRAIRQFFIPIAFMGLLWGATFSCGQQLLTSTIEEKSNKVMEVLLSAVSPLQLMTGKIIGQGMVGLVIMGVYSSVSIFGLFVAAKLDLVQPMQLVYLGVYFFMAYFMVASLMAAVGSAVSDLREANSLMMPVMIILMIPLMLWMPISQAPNGAIATVASFVPPAIPFVMVLRIAADESVPLWQIPVSIVWGYLCVVGMVWLAARIFRVGVLMQGKPPSPIELLKWLRYS